MTQIQLAEWEWPENPRFLMCTPLSHAGAAFFVPTVIKGGTLYVLAAVRPGRGAGDDRGEEDQLHDAGAVDALRADGPPGLADPRPVLARDRLLRRLARSTRSASRRRSSGSGRSSRSTTASPRRRWSSPTSPRGTTSRRRRRARLSSCGRPSAFIRTALLGEDGQPVPQGEPGEICVAGPLLSGGYWKLPDADRRDLPRRLDAHR